jgi:hypothetical protein
MDNIPSIPTVEFRLFTNLFDGDLTAGPCSVLFGEDSKGL